MCAFSFRNALTSKDLAHSVTLSSSQQATEWKHALKRKPEMLKLQAGLRQVARCTAVGGPPAGPAVKCSDSTTLSSICASCVTAVISTVSSRCNTAFLSLHFFDDKNRKRLRVKDDAVWSRYVNRRSRQTSALLDNVCHSCTQPSSLIRLHKYCSMWRIQLTCCCWQQIEVNSRHASAKTGLDQCG